ncbi:radical SAM protein [bacterium]|nr:radical SAM protein [bacterium]
MTDNRSFGYDTAAKSSKKIGERIISKVGSVFYSVLTEQPQTPAEIAEKLSKIFTDIPLSNLEEDALEFLCELAGDGFVRQIEHTENIDGEVWFSYGNTVPFIIDESINNTVIEASDSKPFIDNRLTRLHLSVSSACNERCIHCYFPSHTKGEIMSKDLFSEIITQCKDLNVLNITISGGEPMLNPNLVFFIRLCRENNFSVNILSNLIFLNEDIIAEFKTTPLLCVQTSLYSMNEDAHDSITGIKGSCVRTKNAIERLYALNIPMQINCPIMKQNKESYKDVLNWAKSLNIEASGDYMLFGCFDGSRKNLQCRLDLSEIKSLLIEDQGINISDNKDETANRNSICPVCYSSLCISPSGKVYPCEGWQSYTLGDINSISIQEIWKNSSDVLALRNLTIKDFPKCWNCKDREFCSICLIRNVNESTTLDPKDVNPYFCSVANLKRQIKETNKCIDLRSI